jgi:uncharacterized protein YgiM (DUF1202 family)
VLCAFLLLTGLAAAQTATVKRNINLRPDASTASNPVVFLAPPAQVQLFEPNPTNGFFHVKTSDGKDGWVWGRNVAIQPAATTEAAITSPAGPSGAAAVGEDQNWAKTVKEASD